MLTLQNVKVEMSEYNNTTALSEMVTISKGCSTLI